MITWVLGNCICLIFNPFLMFNTYVKFGQIFVFDMQRLMACKWPDQTFNCHLESLVQICVNINYSTNKCWLIHFDSCCRLCWTKAQRMQRMLNLKINSQVNNTRAQHYGLMQAKSLQSSVIYLIEYRIEADLWLTVTYPSGEQNSTIDRVSWNN